MSLIASSLTLNFILDLSGLTLQAGPRNIVKDEYTPGGSIVGQANLEMDGNEIGTIQHHPIHIPGMGYTGMAMHTQPGSGESEFLRIQYFDRFIILNELSVSSKSVPTFYHFFL